VATADDTSVCFELSGKDLGDGCIVVAELSSFREFSALKEFTEKMSFESHLKL
jgi:hypothetical protein